MLIFDLDGCELNTNWFVALRLLEKGDEESKEELERMENQEMIDFHESGLFDEFE